MLMHFHEKFEIHSLYSGLASLVPGLTTTPLEPHHHYSAEELSMAVATSCVCALVIGFITGFLLARRCSCSSRDDDNPYHVPYLNQLVFLLCCYETKVGFPILE